jgi:hypothetical protein
MSRRISVLLGTVALGASLVPVASAPARAPAPARTTKHPRLQGRNKVP